MRRAERLQPDDVKSHANHNHEGSNMTPREQDRAKENEVKPEDNKGRPPRNPSQKEANRRETYEKPTRIPGAERGNRKKHRHARAHKQTETEPANKEKRPTYPPRATDKPTTAPYRPPKQRHRSLTVRQTQFSRHAQKCRKHQQQPK